MSVFFFSQGDVAIESVNSYKCLDEVGYVLFSIVHSIFCFIILGICSLCIVQKQCTCIWPYSSMQVMYFDLYFPFFKPHLAPFVALMNFCYLFTYLFVLFVCLGAVVDIQKEPKGNLKKLILSFHHVGFECQTQIMDLSSWVILLAQASFFSTFFFFFL